MMERPIGDIVIEAEQYFRQARFTLDFEDKGMFRPCLPVEGYQNPDEPPDLEGTCELKSDTQNDGIANPELVMEREYQIRVFHEQTGYGGRTNEEIDEEYARHLREGGQGTRNERLGKERQESNTHSSDVGESEEPTMAYLVLGDPTLEHAHYPFEDDLESARVWLERKF